MNAFVSLIEHPFWVDGDVVAKLAAKRQVRYKNRIHVSNLLKLYPFLCPKGKASVREDGKDTLFERTYHE